jgi:hypothetical protein
LFAGILRATKPLDVWEQKRTVWSDKALSRIKNKTVFNSGKYRNYNKVTSKESNVEEWLLLF